MGSKADASATGRSANSPVRGATAGGAETPAELGISFAGLPTLRPDVTVKPKSAEMFARSLDALKAADFSTAQTLLQKVVKLQPELSGPWLNLGQVYVQQGRTGEARDAFERAIFANPANCAAYNQLGVLARLEGRLVEAEQSYLACIDRDPNFPAVHLNLGILYEVYLGRLAPALESYRTYQQLSGVPDQRVDGWVIDLERRL
jgi:Flp pilus assembly protein TadD